MLSELTQRSLQRMWDATVAAAEARFPKELTRIAQEANANGMLRSSVHVNLVDRMAADTLGVVAAEMFTQLAEADKSEASPDFEGRIEVLVGLFGDKIRAFHGHMRAAVMELHGRLGLQMMSQSPVWTTELDGALAHAEAFWPAKIRVTIIGTATAAARGAPVANTVNVNQGGTVGNVQFGANSTASARQTVSISAAADVDAILRALPAVADALKQSSAGTPADRLELAELLEDLRTEVGKSKPNRRRLGGILTGAGEVVKLVPGMKATWELVEAHGHQLMKYLGTLTG